MVKNNREYSGDLALRNRKSQIGMDCSLIYTYAG